MDTQSKNILIIKILGLGFVLSLLGAQIIKLNVVNYNINHSVFSIFSFALLQNISFQVSLMVLGFKFNLKSSLASFAISMVFAWFFVFKVNFLFGPFYHPFLGLGFWIYIQSLQLLFSLKFSGWIFINYLLAYFSIYLTIIDNSFFLNTFTFLYAHFSCWIFISVPPKQHKSKINLSFGNLTKNIKKTFYEKE